MVTAPEFKWPGGLELPLLLLFVFAIVVISYLLLAPAENKEMPVRLDQGAKTDIEDPGDAKRDLNHDVGHKARTDT